LVRFDAVMKIRGINPYILVSAKRASELKQNWRKPLPVQVRINEKPTEPWRINMMPAGNGDFYLYLHETIRRASNTEPGDRVTVELSFDDSYRSGPAHPMPRFLSVALRENPDAKRAWKALNPSRKKEVLRYFATLKSSDAKARNLLRLMEALSGGTVRFMARTWTGGK
jgi:hypothetical protein